MKDSESTRGGAEHPHLVSLLAGAPPSRDFAPAFEHLQQSSCLLDQGSYQAAEIGALLGAVDSTQTVLGRCALHRTVVADSEIETARARQGLLAELRSDADVRRKVEELVDLYKPGEAPMFDLAWCDYSGLLDPSDAKMRTGYGYRPFVAVRSALQGICQKIKTPPQPSSAYGRRLFTDIAALEESRYFKLIARGYISEQGPLTPEERKHTVFAARFRPRLLKPLLIASFLALIAGGVIFADARMGGGAATMLATVAAFAIYAILPLAFLYVVVIGGTDLNSYIKPAGRSLLADEQALTALDALGELDALLSNLRYADGLPHKTCLAKIVEADHHLAEFADLRSPILSVSDRNYVGNSVKLDEARLTFVTGPNSGGKSALALSLFQSQLLAQAGLFIVASWARISPADQFHYQIPEVGLLEGGKGRFETELSRARDVLFGATPKTFLVLDEPFEGTSFEERIAISQSALDGFMSIGGTTVLITHNHHLARLYAEREDTKGSVQFLTASYVGKRPAYTFLPGIATHSNAAEIAASIGFSPDDISARVARAKSKSL